MCISIEDSKVTKDFRSMRTPPLSLWFVQKKRGMQWFHSRTRILNRWQHCLFERWEECKETKLRRSGSQCCFWSEGTGCYNFNRPEGLMSARSMKSTSTEIWHIYLWLVAATLELIISPIYHTNTSASSWFYRHKSMMYLTGWGLQERHLLGIHACQSVSCHSSHCLW